MVNVKLNDLEILWTQPQSDSDARVPTAQELAASSHLHQQNLERSQAIERPAGLRNRPTFGCTGKSVIIPTGTLPYAPGHPALTALASDITATLPNLSDTVSGVSRYDYLYLAVFAVEVTSAIDPDVSLNFEWRSQAGTLQTLTKENTRRLRTVWAIVHSAGIATENLIYAALPGTATKTLTVSKAATGTAIDTYRIYPLDPNLTDTKTYTVIEDTFQLIDLVRVWRVQNFNQTGYLWGRTGEGNFDADYHLQPTYRYVGDGWENWESRAAETLRRILLGFPITFSPSYDRRVENLLNGQVGTNLDSPGVAAASPNGAIAAANDQRVSFTNQAITQKTYCLPVATSNSGGFAQASVPFQVNSPIGSYFSAIASDHKVYSVIGRDITGDGTLTGLGGTGALIWTANTNAVVAPGDLVYVVPGIYYPAGSGFPCSGAIEQAFLNAIALNSANIREAQNDIDAYTAPANNETYLAVVGKERGALHYIYKRLTVASSSTGIVALPTNERGVIAFASGTGAPSGRLDVPIITGLTPSTNYNLLVYYPPRSTENWQFQFKVARYAGTQEESLVSGSTIATEPIAIAHTQGGGNGAFLGDGELQYEAIAFRLPANGLPSAVKHYQANYRIQFAGENGTGLSSYRPFMPLPAPGLSLPRVGAVLTLTDGVSSQVRSISAKLLSRGAVLGVIKLPIQCSQVYQVLIAFLIAKDGDRRLLVFTSNEGNPSLAAAIAFDTDSPSFAGIDTFRLY